MSPPAVAELLAALDRAMRARGARWLVYGGQAVLAYGRPRLTADVDVMVDVAGEHARTVIAALAPHGIEPRVPLSEELLSQLHLLPMVHVPTRIPIDLVLAAGGVEDDLFARACLVDIGGEQQVPMISAADLVALKVLAGRRKDLADARGVIAEQGEKLDLVRTRELVAAFEEATGERLLRRLERVVRAAKGRPTE